MFSSVSNGSNCSRNAASGQKVTGALDSQKPNPKNRVRLQKYLAECGFGSRRACEKLIESGSVRIDGASVAEQGVKIDPQVQTVTVDGRPALLEPKIYLILNKPRGYLCTSKDPQGRRTYRELLPDLPARVYTVGRLDFDSEGLILITNDGELCNQLTHPRHEIAKVYTVIASREIKAEEMDLLRRGMKLQGEKMRMAGIEQTRRNAKGFIYRITLKEGRNRQIRRMLSALGIKVKRLRRIRIGPVKMENLGLGQSRPLSSSELNALRMHRQGHPSSTE